MFVYHLNQRNEQTFLYLELVYLLREKAKGREREEIGKKVRLKEKPPDRVTFNGIYLINSIQFIWFRNHYMMLLHYFFFFSFLNRK